MRKGLGRGLGALLSSDEPENEPSQIEATPASTSTAVTPPATGGAKLVDIRKIEPNVGQPRKHFDETALQELAESIKTFGVVQPLILKDCGDYYSIIAGERRFRASRIAGLETVPAIIKDYTDLEILQIALIENIQRQDLTPIEEAACYKRLIEDFFFTQEDIAAKVGKNRSAISNSIKLLELDYKVQNLINEGQLTSSHARVLLSVKEKESQHDLAKLAAQEDLSVRATEHLVTEWLKNPVKLTDDPPMGPVAPLAPPSKGINLYAAYRQAEEELKALLGAKVSILQGKKKGKIEIEYYSQEELDRLLTLFKELK